MAILGASVLSAQTYESTGTYVADSKNEACSRALSLAKTNAMEEAGTLVFSNFNSNTKSSKGKMSKESQYKLTTMALGIAKLKGKYEDVSSVENYQFKCKVDATFEIDQQKFEETLKDMLKQQNSDEKLSGYFEADGYSEEGQSRYKAFSSAMLIAQRNLLDIIQGSKITSLTKIDDGRITVDKIGKLISGSLRNAEVVKKEYDFKTRSAYVVLRVKKAYIAKILTNSK